MDKIANLSREERKELFSETARMMHTTNAIIEKDFWANYDTAKVGTLKLTPEDYRLDELKKDYKAMEHMIFDKKLEFEEIIEILKKLEVENNNL